MSDKALRQFYTSLIPIKSIIKGMEEAIAFVKGDHDLPSEHIHIPDKINVKLIRDHFGMTQDEFSKAFGIPLKTLQHWEQGRRVPSGVSKIFLLVVEREPEAVRRALNA